MLAALLCTTATWATDYNVGTDSELRAAIQNDGANITVTADIDLSNSTLSIASGKMVTINLNNHTLDRKLTKRGEGGGQVITVRSSATLNLSNGTLKGGWGGAGGALVNEGGTVTLTNVTITNNVADDRGGGICNIYRNNFKMQGANIITDNIAGGVPSNVFLMARCLITLTGSIAGSQIGVTLERVPETFTKGYNTYHHGVDPYTFFTCDRPEFNIIYYTSSDEEVNISTIYIKGPNVHIILCDNAKLHVENEIDVWEGHTVYFHAQSSASSMGKLTAAGIGGNMSGYAGGNIEIHGGYFDLQGTYNCAAIGGKYNTGSNITIFDGQINATGGDCAAGIGGGYACENYGNIMIYDGTIEATCY